MKLLNPVQDRGLPPGTEKWDDVNPQGWLVEIEGRWLLYDVNSMALWSLEDESEAGEVELSTVAPHYKSWAPQNMKDIKVSCIVMEASHACNLRCNYCFVDNFYESGMAGSMSFETAKDAIVKLVDRKRFQDNPNTSFSTGFFGGEPLVNWDLFLDYVPWVKGYLHPGQPTFHVTTNGTLLTPDKARFLMKNNFSYIVSLDGTQKQHDETRKTYKGGGSYDQVIEGLDHLRKASNRITLRSTFLPTRVELLERVKYLNKLCDEGRANWVSVEPACMEESQCFDQVTEEMIFRAPQVQKLESEYLDCARWYVEVAKSGRIPRFHNIYKPLERVLHRLHAISECGAGNGYLSVNPERKILACHRETNALIGDLDNGIDPEKRRPWLDNRWYSHKQCPECNIRWACGGGCREESLGVTGDLLSQDPTACAFKYAWLKAGFYILANCPHEILTRIIANPQKSQQSNNTKHRQFKPSAKKGEGIRRGNPFVTSGGVTEAFDGIEEVPRAGGNMRRLVRRRAEELGVSRNSDQLGINKHSAAPGCCGGEITVEEGCTCKGGRTSQAGLSIPLDVVTEEESGCSSCDSLCPADSSPLPCTIPQSVQDQVLPTNTVEVSCQVPEE